MYSRLMTNLAAIEDGRAPKCSSINIVHPVSATRNDLKQHTEDVKCIAVSCSIRLSVKYAGAFPGT